MMSRNNSEEKGKKLFIGGLHLKTTEDGLRDFFGQWGDLTDVVVMRERETGKSRGFGFVTYTTMESVDEAMKNKPHTIDDKQVDTKRAMPKTDSTAENHAAVKRLYIGKIKPSIDEDMLREYFSKFGTITDLNIVMNKQTNVSREFGFVTFDDSDPVDKIILTAPHSVNGCQLETRKGHDQSARTQQQQSRYPQQSRGYGQPAMGGYGGGYDGYSAASYGGPNAGGYDYGYPQSYGTGNGYGYPSQNMGASASAYGSAGGYGSGMGAGGQRYGQHSATGMNGSAAGGGAMRAGGQYRQQRNAPY